MIVRRIDDETLLNLIARFPSGRHPNIHAALHELAERKEAARVKLPPVEAIRRLLIFGSWPTGDDESYCAQKKAVIWLAELDAAEGKAETKEGK